MKNISYTKGKDENKNWLISETSFVKENQPKFEALFAIGNGSMGTRASHEEDYLGKQVGFYKSGSFNNANANETPEIPNAANVWDIELKVDNELFTLDNYDIEHYTRNVNMRNGLLTRDLTYKTRERDIDVRYKTEKFISLSNEKLMVHKATIVVDEKTKLFMKNGICGEPTNYGSQHFVEKALTYKDKIMEIGFETNNSGIKFVWNKVINLYVNGVKRPFGKDIHAASSVNRRNIFLSGEIDAMPGDIIEFESITTLHTSRDLDINNEDITLDELRNISRREIAENRERRFDDLLKESENEWSKWYSEIGFELETENDWEVLSTRFSLFKSRVFTPITDWRMNIDAKGLSSSRYRGHSFWDTEGYVIPFYVMSKPEVARNLLKSIDFMKETAKDKAKELGYRGYAWPWETAWNNHGEACSRTSYLDINSGEKVISKIFSTQIHRGLDIILAFEQYVNATGDKEFLEKYGLDIAFGSIDFYLDRLEFSEEKGLYVMNDVIGPNENKTGYNNNAFINYMLVNSIEKIISWYEDNNIDKSNIEVDFVRIYKEAKEIKDKIYLPKPNENQLIPENDKFLELPRLDMEKYYRDMNDPTVENIYNHEYLNNYQNIKQADIVMLFNNLPHLFDKETMAKNFDYYEEVTIHGSSLSRPIHSIVASMIGKDDEAYRFFLESTKTDLGDNMRSCDDGIHSASITAIMLVVYRGLLGIEMFDGTLSITPKVPLHWKRVRTLVNYKGSKIEIEINEGVPKLNVLERYNNEKIKVLLNNEELII